MKYMDTNHSGDGFGTAPGEATPIHASGPSRRSTRRDVLRTIALHVWLIFFALSVWQFGGRNFLLGGSGMLLCITAVPVIALDSWQERLTWGLTLACGCLGFVAGIVLCLYVLLRFDGFVHVFGGKAGLGNVLLVAFSLALFSGFAGHRCVGLAQRLRKPRTARPTTEPPPLA